MHAMLARGREHYLGQKGPPLMRSLSNFSYEHFNILEWMHNLARAHDNFLELLIGRGDGVFDQRARASCRHLNIFPDLWPEKMQYLSQIRTRRLSELSDDDISRQQHGWCRKWLRMCGIIRPQTERVRELRRRVIALRDAAVRIPIQGTNLLSALRPRTRRSYLFNCTDDVTRWSPDEAKKLCIPGTTATHFFLNRRTTGTPAQENNTISLDARHACPGSRTLSWPEGSSIDEIFE